MEERRALRFISKPSPEDWVLLCTIIGRKQAFIIDLKELRKMGAQFASLNYGG